jgi:hypothetical protein
VGRIAAVQAWVLHRRVQAWRCEFHEEADATAE